MLFYQDYLHQGHGHLQEIPEATTSSGTGTSTTISDLTAGTYTYTVTDAVGATSVPSGNVVINPQPPTPNITNQTTTILTGTTFTVTPAGVPPGTTYTWTAPVYTGGVTGGSAQTTPQTSICGILTIPSGSGTAVYTVTPVAGSCTGNTFTVTVTVTFDCTPVTIGTQPSDKEMCASTGNASFTVVANGIPPFTYQWEYNNGVSWAAVIKWHTGRSILFKYKYKYPWCFRNYITWQLSVPLLYNQLFCCQQRNIKCRHINSKCTTFSSGTGYPNTTNML